MGRGREVVELGRAATRSAAILNLPQCRHMLRSKRTTVPKVSGLYTGTAS